MVAERAALFDAFIAYGGTYKINGSKVPFERAE
jgi:hypothetical protein